MELAFDVAGCALRWRFVGASRLHARLAQRPWEGDGGVLLTSLARDVDMERTLQGVAQLVRSYDAAAGVQLTVLTDLTPDPAHVLHAAASVARDIVGRRRLQALARAFDRPRVWVLGFEQDPTALADGLEQTLEDVRKAGAPEGRLWLPWIVLGHRHRGRRGADLCSGFPVDSPFGAVGAPEQTLWAVYLHWRIAWFTGGRPGWAEALGRSVTAGLKVGDDDGFEQRLCAVAREAWDAQPAERQREVLGWLSAWPDRDVSATRGLADAELLWHPAHDPDRGLQPVPWIARALLQRDPPQPGRALLRACDACEPLAAVLLSRCLQLEAMFKARADVDHRGIDDGRLADRLPTLVTQRDRERGSGLVPPSSAARAGRLFDYAGINDALPFVRDGVVQRLGYRLRDVRNAVAHGHPPSWAAMGGIAEIWRKVAG